MITHEQIPMVLDHPVHDSNGDKIGDVAHVFLDDATGLPKWLCVKTGLLRTKETFVPLHEANVTAGGIEVPYDKEHVKNAPDVDLDEGGHLSAEQERLLYRHYDMGWDEAWERANEPGSLTGWADSGGRRERERLGHPGETADRAGDGTDYAGTGTDYAVTRRGERYGTDDPSLGSMDRLDAEIPGTRPGEPLAPRDPATRSGELFGGGDTGVSSSEPYDMDDPATRSKERFEGGDPVSGSGERFVGDAETRAEKRFDADPDIRAGQRFGTDAKTRDRYEDPDAERDRDHRGPGL
ncbi:PRC-barrel domain-containing protein [Microbispora sp. H10885]|uniref:PRC-barrel domain-containing protein n=1 Tax=Microbispora sp. H10885 TaxID=2729110 RepID=UPI0016012375|nr:PRC-barrel domain-containing protein [Microbispora sp. H10885]